MVNAILCCMLSHALKISVLKIELEKDLFDPRDGPACLPFIYVH